MLAQSIKQTPLPWKPRILAWSSPELHPASVWRGEEQGKEAQGQQQQLLPQQGGACLEEAGLSQAAEVQEPLLRGAVTLGTSTTL